ncbi:hsp70 family protein [Catellatospora citrea]|uniref:Pyrrolo-quinoline quinone repeat domain-containing protein n=1 Tax=Catellatospora citrea TaxID=53366 RepID=A0A8J3NZS4_9ACTN|nr:hsp70 family protein [Catellatospora citrea]RKE11170.1 putative pyrroloquinoline-quinone binding quinoprotein [Catellatospora citrea]GIF96635.1 hypothetical protein Cci01nite_17290 [Catellatospora citrea]
MPGWTMAVDFGTCFTTVAVGRGGEAALIEVEQGRYLPSAVALADDGGLLTGRAAASRAVAVPHLAERLPKQALAKAEPTVRLGTRDVPAVELVAAVLRRVSAEAVRVAGGAPDAVLLTHPARWDEPLLARLVEAARLAGLPAPRLMPEPIAAAAWYVDDTLAPGALVAVFDLGGGTLDTAVLRRTAAGFALAGPPGGDPHLGGEDFDEALWDLVAEQASAADARAWAELAAGADQRARRDRAMLRRDVVEAKEALSEHLAHSVLPPGFAAAVPVTRAEFEQRIRPLVRRGADELQLTLDRAGLRADQLAALYLTGGASRVPLVAAEIGAALGVRPTLARDPKGVVACGALRRVRRSGERAAVPAPAPAVTWLSAYRAGRVPGEGPLPDGTDPGTAPAGWRPWSAALPVVPAAAAYAGETLYVAGSRVCAVDVFAAAVRWTSPPMPAASRLEVVGDTVYAYADGTIMALRASDGAPRWAFRAPGTMLAGPLGVHVATATAVLLIGPDGGPRWRHELPAGTAGLAVPGDGRAYATDGAGRLYALDAATGEPQWTAGCGAGPGGPVVLGDLLCVPGTDGMRAFDTAGGELLWHTPGPGGTAMVTAGVVLAAGAGVVAYGLDDGAVRWRTGAGSALAALPAIGHGVLCGRAGDTVVAFDAVSGTPRWAHRTGPAATDPVPAADAVCLSWAVGVPGLDGTRTHLTALDPHTGAARWRSSAAGTAALGPVAVGRMLFVVLSDSSGVNLHALDAATGRSPGWDTIGGAR